MVVKLSPIERLVLCCCDMEGAAVMTKADFAKCRDDTTKLSFGFRPFNMVASLALAVYTILLAIQTLLVASG